MAISQNAPSRRPLTRPRKPPTTKPPPPQEEEIDVGDQCPEPNGFFADAEQCDKYYACTDGAIVDRLCPDGMVFNDFDSTQEKCDLPFNIDCSQRSKLREFYF